MLVLGAGFVAGPLIRYFLDRPDVEVRVADVEVEKAKALVGGRPSGSAIALNLNNEETLKKEIGRTDIVVSLVPNTCHPLVAKFCVALGKNMVTASYVSEAMRALENDARRAGIIILNEVGLDPGIDHMEAMRIIHEIKNQGGRILEFTSFCGGLPAPEANTNPFSYKLSWSPRGVLLASKNAAHYLKNGKEVLVPAEELFDHTTMISIKGLGVFEGYPNRNALPYIELYGIPETQTMYRGTLRYPGWCETFKKIGELDLLDQTEKDLKGLTYASYLLSLLDNPEERDVKSALRNRLKLMPDSNIIGRWEWLGLLSEDSLPLERGSAMDILEGLMVKKLRYEKGERDMIILRHEFIAADGAGGKQRITSTLIDFGIPGGDSSMARTVGLPAAAGTRLILEGKVQRKGVCIPVYEEIYRPILDELRSHGIVFQEEKERLQ